MRALGSSSNPIGASRAVARAPRRLGDPGLLLRHPVRSKIALAHAAALLAATAAAGALGFGLGRIGASFLLSGWPAALAAGTALAALGLPLLAARIALAPLRELERAAEQVERGDLAARAVLSPFADDEMARVVTVFNRLLDGIAAEQQRLRAVAAHAFRAQEGERMRIARELQEEWAQRLAAAQFRLRALRRAGDPAAREALLDEVRTALDETTDSLRHYARGLYPPALADLGPTAAIRALARSLEESGEVRVRYEAEEVRGLLSGEQELALFRVVQEALANATRHASASVVSVRVRRNGLFVEAEVRDDGIGFDALRVSRERPCLGLFGIQERAMYAGGTASVWSRRGRGTRVRVQLPTSDRVETAPARAAAVGA